MHETKTFNTTYGPGNNTQLAWGQLVCDEPSCQGVGVVQNCNQYQSWMCRKTGFDANPMVMQSGDISQTNKSPVL